MKTIRLQIELTYDDQSMHSFDRHGLQWFTDILKGDSDLILHSNEIGDTVGEVRVTTPEAEIYEAIQ